MIFVWLVIIFFWVAVSLPILRMFGIVDWEWKYVLAPIWGPLLMICGWIMVILIPVAMLSCTMIMLTGGGHIR
jgi:hypothetical protein